MKLEIRSTAILYTHRQLTQGAFDIIAHERDKQSRQGMRLTGAWWSGTAVWFLFGPKED